MSGCDVELRRGVIEDIVAGCSGLRVVVVTAGGLTSTTEQDGQVVPLSTSDVEPQTPLTSGAPADEGVGVESSASARLASSAMDEMNPKQLADDVGEARASGNLNGFAAVPVPTSPDLAAAAASNLEGWLSCSSYDEMAEVVAKLASSRDCDYIIAEGSDVSIEPQDFAQLFQSRGGASLRVDTLVSVLDADRVLEDLDTHVSSAGGQGGTDGSGTAFVDEPSSAAAKSSANSVGSRPMLTVSLVENANVIIVGRHGGEATTPESFVPIKSLLSTLNFKASIVPVSSGGAIPVDMVVNTNLYDPNEVLLNATWKRVLAATRSSSDDVAKPTVPKALKDATFVYRARRPFHPTRLYDHIRAVATFTGVIRSTGRIWLATRMLAPLEWNQAGDSATFGLGELFWAAVPEREWPADGALRESIMKDWDNQYGDRETEMVFVGTDIDKVRLQGLLDGCLLQDEEMVFTKSWENFVDPFVEWVPLIEEDEEPVRPSNEEVVDSNPGPTKALSDVAEDEHEMPGRPDAKLEEEESNYDGKNDIVEGELEGPDLPEDVLEQVSALDVFERGFGEDATRISQPADDGAFDREDVVIVSWDGSVADGILRQMPKVGLPVTIVTGFLGSGKTTLLNYILKAKHGLKIAVLVNEFGAIDIDNQLVEKGDWSSDDEVMELANGCICCSINDSFIGAVAKILERKDDVDYLIVETTGVADPVPVINSLMVSDLAEEVRVDGILTLLDTENFDPKTHMASSAALAQIQTADTILLSKTDIASAAAVEEVIAYIKSIRPGARILRSQRGRVPINMILDVGIRMSDSPAHMEPVTKDLSKHSHEGHSHDHGDDECGPDCADESHGHATHAHDHSDSHTHDGAHGEECGPDCTDESHSHNQKDHLEADGFVSTSFKSDQPLDPELFMDRFLQHLPDGVFRAKGLLRFYGYGQRYIFQLSGRRYQFEEDEWPVDQAPGNQLVIIGKDLDIDALRVTLESCLAVPSQE